MSSKSNASGAAPSGSRPSRRAAAAERRRLMLGYVVAGALTLAVVVGLVDRDRRSGGDDDATRSTARRSPRPPTSRSTAASCTTDAPDGREGTPPPALQQGDLQTAAEEAGCELQLDLEDEGITHITKESEIPDYETNPPTSGNHNPEQLADGAYSEMPEPGGLVHSLEHGRIEIQYSPDLPEEDQLALKGVFDERPRRHAVVPQPRDALRRRGRPPGPS